MANYTTYEKNREIIIEYDKDGDIEYNYIKNIINREIYKDPYKHFKFAFFSNIVRIDSVPQYIKTEKEIKYNKNGDIDYIILYMNEYIELKTIYDNNKITEYVLYEYNKIIDKSKHYYLLYLRNFNKLFFND